VGANAAFGGSDEFQNRPGTAGGERRLRRGSRHPQILSGAEKRVIKPFEFEPLLRFEAGAAQAYNVQTHDAVQTGGHGEWWQVLADPRAALHHGQLPDAAELMHETIAGDERAILDDHMSREHRAAAKDDLVANPGVVPDMTVWRKQVVRADDRVFRQGVRAIHGNVFAKDVMVANEKTRRLAGVFQVHRRIANDATGVKAVVRAGNQHPGEIDVRPDDTM